MECIAVSELELLMYVFLRRNEPLVNYEDIDKFERAFTQSVIEHWVQSSKYQCVYVYPLNGEIFSRYIRGTMSTGDNGYELYGHIDERYASELIGKYNDPVFADSLDKAYTSTFGE